MNAGFKDMLEVDFLLSGADNMISLSSPKMKVKNTPFARTFATFPVSFLEPCLV